MAFDVYLRKATENGKVIFPMKYCLTDTEMAALTKEGKAVKSLESLKREKDIWEYSGQYLNDPVDTEAVEFKPDWFHQFVTDEALAMKLSKAKTLLSIDPAFRLKQTNDYSGLVVTKTTEENFVYVMEALHVKVNAKGLVDKIFDMVDRYDPDKVLVETVSAQLLLLDLLRDEMRKRNKFFQMEELKPSTNETKAMRIRGLIPHYANGRVFHTNGLKDLENEMQEFPRGSHDDLIDALSYQVPYWKSMPGSKPKQAAPYMSLNWWKKQSKPRYTVIGSMFRDLVPPVRR